MNRRPIVIIEDDASETILITRALERAGLNREFLTFNGEQAVEFLFNRKTDWGKSELPALIILDLVMPTVSGLDILKRLKTDSQTRRLPTVVLSNSDRDSHLHDAYSLGANSFIAKSPNFDEKIDGLVAYWFRTVALPPA